MNGMWWIILSIHLGNNYLQNIKIQIWWENSAQTSPATNTHKLQFLENSMILFSTRNKYWTTIYASGKFIAITVFAFVFFFFFFPWYSSLLAIIGLLIYYFYITLAPCGIYFTITRYHPVLKKFDLPSTDKTEASQIYFSIHSHFSLNILIF